MRKENEILTFKVINFLLQDVWIEEWTGTKKIMFI